MLFNRNLAQPICKSLCMENLIAQAIYCRSVTKVSSLGWSFVTARQNCCNRQFFTETFCLSLIHVAGLNNYFWRRYNVISRHALGSSRATILAKCSWKASHCSMQINKANLNYLTRISLLLPKF